MRSRGVSAHLQGVPKRPANFKFDLKNDQNDHFLSRNKKSPAVSKIKYHGYVNRSRGV